MTEQLLNENDEENIDESVGDNVLLVETTTYHEQQPETSTRSLAESQNNYHLRDSQKKSDEASTSASHQFARDWWVIQRISVFPARHRWIQSKLENENISNLICFFLHIVVLFVDGVHLFSLLRKCNFPKPFQLIVLTGRISLFLSFVLLFHLFLFSLASLSVATLKLSKQSTNQLCLMLNKLENLQAIELK